MLPATVAVSPVIVGVAARLRMLAAAPLTNVPAPLSTPVTVSVLLLVTLPPVTDIAPFTVVTPPMLLVPAPLKLRMS